MENGLVNKDFFVQKRPLKRQIAHKRPLGTERSAGQNASLSLHQYSKLKEKTQTQTQRLLRDQAFKALQLSYYSLYSCLFFVIQFRDLNY